MEVIVMGTETVNWEAALADIDARIAKLQATREGIMMILSQGGTTIPDGGGSTVSPSAFLGMSIPDAAKKHLSTVKGKRSTQALIDALVAGGLPPAKYTTVYNILTRRQKLVGDIVNMKGDWGLAEWYPNHRFTKSAKDGDEESKTPAEVKKTASA
jgi:hypothetical protein